MSLSFPFESHQLPDKGNMEQTFYLVLVIKNKLWVLKEEVKVVSFFPVVK